MMCEYCEKGKKIKNTVQEDECRYGDDDCANIDGSILHVEIDAPCPGGFVGADSDYRINFCPMCGVKLKNAGGKYD